MSEIQSVTNPDWIKYGVAIVGFLFATCNALILYIFKQVKKDIDKIWNRYNFVREMQQGHHDDIIIIKQKLDIHQ